jgi:hypothetical protein
MAENKRPIDTLKDQTNDGFYLFQIFTLKFLPIQQKSRKYCKILIKHLSFLFKFSGSKTMLSRVDPDPGKGIKVDPDPERGSRWIWIRLNVVDSVDLDADLKR